MTTHDPPRILRFDSSKFQSDPPCATDLVQSVLEYKNILVSAPSLVDLLNQGQLTPYFSIARIHTVLVNLTCTICTQFGGHVFLPGLQRCCLRCGVEKPELLPSTLLDTSKHYGVKSKDLEELPKPSISLADHRDSRSKLGSTTMRRQLISRIEVERFGRSTPKGRQPLRLRQTEFCLSPLSFLDLTESTLDHRLR